MRSVLGWTVAMMAAGFALSPTPGIADMGPIDMLTGGGAAAPKSPHQSIRLESQEVTIHLRKSTYTVDAIFQLFNTGETTTEWTGFPKRMETRDVPQPRAAFIRFNTWANGRPVEFSEQRESDKGRRWLVHQIKYPGHENTTIRVSYEAPYYIGANTRMASYLYGTGSYWKDNIGRAVFIIDSSYVGGTKNTYTDFQAKVKSRRISENLEMYEIRDFKPVPEEEFSIMVKD